MRVDPLALRALAELAGTAERPNRAIDARVFEALGWQVRRGAEARHPNAWRIRGPLARVWQGLPEVSRDPMASFVLLPADWEWRVGRDPRHGGRVGGWAPCSNCEPYSVSVGGNVPNPTRLSFEARCHTPGLAALTVTLRALMALHIQADARRAAA